MTQQRFIEPTRPKNGTGNRNALRRRMLESCDHRKHDARAVGGFLPRHHGLGRRWRFPVPLSSGRFVTESDYLIPVKVIKQVLSAPRSPWQRAYVGRLIGSIRLECLDHVIVIGEESLQRALKAYAAYYHDWRTHLSLGKDAPQGRPVQSKEQGDV